MKIKGLALLASAVMLAAAVTGCGNSGNEEQTLPSNDTVMEQPEATDATEATEEPGAADNLYVCTVTTPYGDLYYQEQWSEFMRTELEETEQACRVSFKAELNGKLYPLFEVTVGEAEGDPVRELTDSQGVKHNVYVYVEESLDVSDLDEGNQRLLYAMQEDINFLIENIK